MNTRKGFTLVELLVVIAILAILATVSVVGYTAFIENADETAAETEAAEINKAILTALTLEKSVVLDIKDGGKVVCVRSGNTFTVRSYDATKDAKLETVNGLKEELTNKLTWDATNGLVYTYDDSNVYDVVTNTKK